MSGNGALIRSLRAGGGAGLVAAQELVKRAQSGQVTTAELKEVQQVISSPELRDTFRALSHEVSSLLSTGRGQVFRDVQSLTPDTERLTDARNLPERFLSDLKLVEQQLLQHPGMTKGQKADRLFRFFEPYAQRFTALAHGTAQAQQAASAAPEQGGALATRDTGRALAGPLDGAELERALRQFDKALTLAGFEGLQVADGRTGLEAARQMLEARSLDAQAQLRPAHLDAPGWKDNAPAERSLKLEIDAQRQAVSTLEGKSLALPQLHARQAPRPEENPDGQAPKRSKDRAREGVLGGRMLWNVLHLLRGEELDDVARRDAMNALAVSAVLVLVLGGVLVGILALM